MPLTTKIQQQLNIIKNNYISQKYSETISKSKKLLKELPDSSYLMNIIGLSYNGLGDHKKAKNIFNKILNTNPNNLDAKNNYATTLKYLGEIEEAEKTFQSIIDEDQKNIHALNNLANIKRNNKKNEEAIILYKKILEINNNLPIVHYNLSLTYLQLKKRELAKKHALIVNTLDSKFILSDQILNTLINYRNDKEHFETLQTKLNDESLNDNLKSLLNFMLGKAYEDKKDYKNSFLHYQKGNFLRRKNIKYNIQFEEELFEKIQQLFIDPKILNLKLSQDHNQKIIFICGMPRSGTTLVDQVISTHSKVQSMEETNFINKIIDSENLLNKKAFLTNIKSQEESIYKKFLNMADKFKFKKTYLTDKSLFNFKYIGFIKVFFPQCKILVLKRDLNNNLLSIFKNSFQSQTLNWAYDTEEIESFYKLYLKYLNLWQKIFPESFLLVNYEDLVVNLEKQTKKILDYCGLDWEVNCLKYYEKNQSSIATVSSNQASKPIYNDSLDKYRLYEKFFQKKTAL
jgi:tetratricopeptide (TPR) repeat protein